MATADLVTRLLVNANGFNSGINKAKQQVKGFSSSGKKDIENLSSSFNGLASSIDSALGGEFQSIIGQIKSIGDIGKKAFSFLKAIPTTKLTASLKQSVSVTNQLGGVMTANLVTPLATQGALLAANVTGFKSLGNKIKEVIAYNKWREVNKELLDYAGLLHSASLKMKILTAFNANPIVKEFKKIRNASFVLGNDRMTHNVSVIGALFKAINNVTLSIGRSIATWASGLGAALRAMTAIYGVVALLSAAITAIVAAIAIAVAATVAWLIRTEEGYDKFQMMMAQAKGFFNALGDSMSALGAGIANLFSGKWDFSKLGAVSFSESIKKATESTKELIALNKEYYGTVDNVAQGEALRAAKLKETVQDKRLEAEETDDQIKKVKLLREAYESMQEANKINLGYSQQILDIEIKKFNANDSNSKDVKALAEMRIAQAEKSAAARREELRLLRQLQTAEKALSEESEIRLTNVEKLSSLQIKGIKSPKVTIDVSSDPLKATIQQIEAIKNKLIYELAALTNKPIQLFQNVSIDGLNKAIDKAKQNIVDLNNALSGAISSGLSSMISGVFDAIAEDENPLKAVLSSIADTMKQFGSALIAFGISVDAFKKAFANPYAAIAAGIGLTIAGGLLGVAANKMQKFEDGGIVGGSSYTGDNVMARVNSGEMILNKSQQRNLFNMINSGVTEQQQQTINWRISGSDLVGVISNYSKKKGKVL